MEIIMQREKLGSRIGFILLSAGCAIGLGNVWRFPYVVGEYGGAAFILIYLAFLILFGLPIMTMEFSVGRASRQSIAGSFKALEPKGTRWHLFGFIGMAGNYILVMFYTVVAGWMFAYFFKTLRGDFTGMDAAGVSAEFGGLVSNPWILTVFMLVVVVSGFAVCSLGVQKGVEKVTKVMMIALLAIIALLAVHSVTLDGAGEGLHYYLIPDFGKMRGRLGEVIFAALGQAFFTLSIGMGSMAIFGSYISRDRRLLGESVTIAALDTFVAVMAGLIIIPACAAYGIPADTAGPSLIFETLPNVFNNMEGGRIWGTLFFLFMIFAAMSTIIAVFENIISCCMDIFGWSRRKASIINLVLVAVLSMPCVLGFNVLSGVEPLGANTNILDLEDFIISNNILPLGSIVYVLFCTTRKGWGYENFLEEANTGRGIRFHTGLRVYVKYILPPVILILWVQGYIAKFF